VEKYVWGVEQNEPKILGRGGKWRPHLKYDGGSSLGNSPRPHITTTFEHLLQTMDCLSLRKLHFFCGLSMLI